MFIKKPLTWVSSLFVAKVREEKRDGSEYIVSQIFPFKILDMVWKNPPIVNNDINLFIFIGFSISWMKWSVRDNSSAAGKHYLSNVGEDSIHISCQIIAEEKKGFWNETPIKSPRAWIAAPPFHIFYFIPKLKWLEIMTWEISFWNGEKWIKFLMAYIFELKWVFYIASGPKKCIK